MTIGTPYRLQLLFYGNQVEDRRFDIEGEGSLLVDEISSLGVTTGGSPGTVPAYSGTHGILCTYDFTATDGVFDLRVGDIGGLNEGSDRNPIWQGLTLEQIPEPSSFAFLAFAVTPFLFRRRRR